MSELVEQERAPEDPLLKWRGRGRLPHGETVDAYLARIRNGVEIAADAAEPTGVEMLPDNAVRQGRSAGQEYG